MELAEQFDERVSGENVLAESCLDALQVLPLYLLEKHRSHYHPRLGCSGIGKIWRPSWTVVQR